MQYYLVYDLEEIAFFSLPLVRRARSNADQSDGHDSAMALKYVQEHGGWKILSDAQVKLSVFHSLQTPWGKVILYSQRKCWDHVQQVLCL